jgi:2-keto-4-pentenoate hydratase/2-oxohepta-3-ene-1,7-dioic acid hydratase in catechol pathway
VIVGKEAYNVSEETAMDYVFGYASGNDSSHRDWQIKRGGGQWALGKGFNGWAPIGPAIIAPRRIRNPGNLKISTAVNGKVVQDSSTSDLIFSIPRLISFLSQGTTLLPGDVIFTGT